MISYKPVFLVLGFLLSKLALFMYIPFLMAVVTGTQGALDFGFSAIITHIGGLVCVATGGKTSIALKVKDAFLITTLVWVLGSAFASLPFVFINEISFTNAYFETMSGITTTGSTVLAGLDNMAPSILLWRSLLQWFGGVGFIVMAIAILPMINVGGMRLFQTESSDWSTKSAPRMKSVAKSILSVYLLLTFLCVMSYLLSGMTVFDAINHALTTVSTGGYSTTDASMNGFSPMAHWVAIIFMFAGGMPFIQFVAAINQKSLSCLVKDAQIRAYFKLVVVLSLVVACWLALKLDYPFIDAIRIATFNIVTVMTTTGFALDDFSSWGSLPTILFCFVLLMGACSGSTSGGFKIFRIQIATSLLKKQVFQLVHPSGVFTLRYNKARLSDSIVQGVTAFAFVYALTIIFIAMLLAIIGLDPVTSLSGAITSVANVGPGLGSIIGPTGNFSTLPDAAKWILSLGMLMGRLEILTIVVVLSPCFWRI
ncbi:TrkH family potassium uptake protein [Vibrio harveyi]